MQQIPYDFNGDIKKKKKQEFQFILGFFYAINAINAMLYLEE